MRYNMLALILGFILDLIIGDPHWLYHPVRAIGLLITGLEKVLRKIFPKTNRGEFVAGIFLLILTSTITTGVIIGILAAAYLIHPIVCFVLMVFMDYQLLATKALKDESMKVYAKLKEKDLPGARYAVSMIVGRDTESLDEKGVTKAAVETVAENTSDGIIAPMLFMFLGGPVLGFFYKSVNTQDSMVGYKNDKYLYFGRAAAKFDDVVNYIPARLSALLMILATCFTSFDTKNAYKIWKRDRRNHASPNSAQTEAVMAGALDVQLAGNAYYFGKLYEKPTIGDPIREIVPEDIKNSNRLLYITSGLTIVICSVLTVLIDMLYILVLI